MKLFGSSVKLSGYTLLVGAPNDNEKNGSVYVYMYDGTNWKETQKVVPQSPVLFQSFGAAVDLGHGIALVSSISSANNDSASGSVYIFNTSTKNWTEQAIVTSSKKGVNDLFGASIAIVSSTHILISAPRASDMASDCGAVYSFIESDSEWKVKQKLISPNFRKEGLFGCSISYSRNRLLVGAMQELVDSINSGAAYFYQLDNKSNWIVEERLVPDKKRDQDYFGMSVFVKNDIAFVGSPKWDRNKLNRNGDIGCADVFSLADSNWSHVGKVFPVDGQNDDHFGMAIASFENTLVIGSRLNDNNALNSGSVYFYDLQKLYPSIETKFIPSDFQLYNNYPNPFNSLTTIKYDLPYPTKVEIVVYDILGRKIIELVNSEIEAGRKHVTWNGTNSNGHLVSSGIYIVHLVTSKFNNAKKMILLK
jgi:hypothetical protein